MRADSLAPYESALLDQTPLGLHTAGGEIIPLDVTRWLAPPDDVDRAVIERCAGPTLDVGCGPGRFVAALAERGVPALGLDIAEVAVELTRRRGTPALVRDVFENVPGAGRWPEILLMDGNIGIGGHPVRLLTRIRKLLSGDGVVLVETDRDDAVDEQLQVRFNVGGEVVGPPFQWAHVGIDALAGYACAAGLSCDDSWRLGDRTFVSLSVERRSSTTRTT